MLYKPQVKLKFYDFPRKEKDIYGEWKQTTFLTWLDTTNFYIDIPANTIVDLEEVSDRFALGLSFPKIILVATSGNRRDTILKGFYDAPVTRDFKIKRRFLGTTTFYYDFE